MQSTLGRVRQLGAAKLGTHHWFMQRITAVANLFLMFWMAWGLKENIGASHTEAVAWLGSGLNPVFAILAVWVSLYHATLGIQVVAEDYVHTGWRYLLLMLCVRFAAVVLAGIAAVSVLQVSLIY